MDPICCAHWLLIFITQDYNIVIILSCERICAVLKMTIDCMGVSHCHKIILIDSIIICSLIYVIIIIAIQTEQLVFM